MELDEARAADRLDEQMPNLINLLSLPMERFWQGEDRSVPAPPKPFAELRAKPNAEPCAELSAEPKAEPSAKLTAEPSALRWECYGAHTETLSRFDRFRRSIRSTIFSQPAKEPPSQSGVLDKD